MITQYIDKDNDLITGIKFTKSGDVLISWGKIAEVDDRVTLIKPKSWPFDHRPVDEFVALRKDVLGFAVDQLGFRLPDIDHNMVIDSIKVGYSFDIDGNFEPKVSVKVEKLHNSGKQIATFSTKQLRVVLNNAPNEDSPEWTVEQSVEIWKFIEMAVDYANGESAQTDLFEKKAANG